LAGVRAYPTPATCTVSNTDVVTRLLPPSSDLSSLQHDVLLSIFAPFLTGSGRNFGRARGGVLRIVVREDRDRVSA